MVILMRKYVTNNFNMEQSGVLYRQLKLHKLCMDTSKFFGVILVKIINCII